MVKHHLVTVCVNFTKATPFQDRATGRVSESRGYFRKFGISVQEGECVEKAVSSLVTDGVVSWDDTTIEPIDWDSLNDELQKNSNGFGRKRIWYEGPAFLFP
jgi:hypothetical protein